jgi:hypothetical protein
MAHLRPCDACLRHVRADVARCPFCDHALAIDAISPAEPTTRISRAARMAFAAAAVTTGTIAAACGGGNKPAETGGTTESSATAAPTPTPTETASATAAPTATPNMAKPYGAPPAEGLLV